MKYWTRSVDISADLNTEEFCNMRKYQYHEIDLPSTAVIIGIA